MKHTVDGTHPDPTKRLGFLSGPALLSFALVLGACSSTDSPTGTATTPDTTVETTNPPVATDTTTEPTPSSPIEPAPSTDPDRDDVQAYLDQLETSGFGGVVAVREGADITTRAYGVADRENDVPIDAETVFDIASITKQFTAAAILRLEMEGRLSVDDTLGDHVPGLPDDKAAITLHQLLTHTAGVPRSLGLDYEPIGRSDFLARVGVTPLASAPGDQYEYSNAGYSLLAIVIELETGESYEAYLHRVLFEPAGMLDTGYVLPDWNGHTMAVGYASPAADRIGRPDEQPWDVDGPYWHLRGNGGLLSTAADMLRWDEALLGDQVLDATAKAKLFTPHVSDGPDEGVDYGYGWQVIQTPMGTPLITHNGFTGAFFADFLRFVDQDVTIFVATNWFEDDDADVALELANHVFDGDLTAMLDSASESESETDANSEYDAALAACAFLSIDSLPESAAIETLPDSPAGHATKIFVDLLADGDAAARLDFAAQHVSAELGRGDLPVIADDIEQLQDRFAGYEATVTLMQDDLRFHLLMVGPDDDLVLSVEFDETDPERLLCLVVSP